MAAHNWFTRLWPRAEVLRLRRENESLSLAVRHATERAADLHSRLEELRDKPCATCETLKAVVNSVMLASGSKLKMFDGIGPTLPAPKFTETPEPIQGRQRASQFTKQFNAEYLQQTAEMERKWSEHLANAPLESPESQAS